ncbi:MAG: glycoside hydrolase family 127 protein [Clostridia bacterium]|nr:glycoside hydrolase family 127 protein [Clostridia bacterium]
MEKGYAGQVPGRTDVRIRGGFWGEYTRRVRDLVIPYQWEALNDRIPGAEPSWCIANMRAAAEYNRTGIRAQEFRGMVFQDSDLAKWLEAAAYRLAAFPDPEFEKTVFEAADLVVAAMEPDGYLQTHFTLNYPERKWTNVRDWHEMYCAGHMMEAAVALYECTGNRRLLDAMHRNARHIAGVFGPEDGKKHGYPGHPEIELALVRMYGALGDPMLLELAAYFVNERGSRPSYFDREAEERGEVKPARPAGHTAAFRDPLQYFQAHKPLREQEGVEGHSVRALYLLAGAIDVAAETGDESLAEACRRLFANCVDRRMYVTGGVGSQHHGESFTFDYDLPNDTVYAETCASIALAFAAQRMLRMRPSGAVADAMERALYNTVVAGMSLDGTKFFYVNPLAVWPEGSEKACDLWHVLPTRPSWFGCACCPPNLARLVMSLGSYQYTIADGTVHVQLYADSDASLDLGDGRRAGIAMRTGYPVDGRIILSMTGGTYPLALRIPGWCKSFHLSVDGVPAAFLLRDGYAVLEADWAGQSVSLELAMPVERVYAGPQVPHDAGLVCLQRGPMVYCLEEADNGKRLWNLSLPADVELTETFEPDLLEGVTIVRAVGCRRADDDEGVLYRNAGRPVQVPVPLTFIPYYAWANRAPGEMRVWIHEG